MTSPSPASVEPITVADSLKDRIWDATRGQFQTDLLAMLSRVVELEAGLAAEKKRVGELEQQFTHAIYKAPTEEESRLHAEWNAAEDRAEASEARATAAESLCNSYRGIAEQQSDLLGQERARATALLEALRTALKVADEAREEWDKAPSGMKAGKLLIALSDPSLKYRADITAMHAAINAGASNDRK